MHMKEYMHENIDGGEFGHRKATYDRCLLDRYCIHNIASSFKKQFFSSSKNLCGVCAL